MNQEAGSKNCFGRVNLQVLELDQSPEIASYEIFSDRDGFLAEPQKNILKRAKQEALEERKSFLLMRGLLKELSTQKVFKAYTSRS